MAQAWWEDATTSSHPSLACFGPPPMVGATMGGEKPWKAELTLQGGSPRNWPIRASLAPSKLSRKYGSNGVRMPPLRWRHPSSCF